jgi:hypothetical protein
MLQSIDDSEVNPRIKRGLINIVGNIQKTLRLGTTEVLCEIELFIKPTSMLN